MNIIDIVLNYPTICVTAALFVAAAVNRVRGIRY